MARLIGLPRFLPLSLYYESQIATPNSPVTPNLVLQPYSLQQRFHGALRLSQLGPNAISRPIADPQPCLQWLQQPHRQAPPPLMGDANADTIALLPLWLFTHESWRQRLAWLQQIPTWQTTSLNNQASLWLYGEAIAQVIRPQARLDRLFTSLEDRWQRQTHQAAPQLSPIWTDLLPQLSQWQQQHTPLNQVVSALPDRPETVIAASLFALVTSGSDWAIAQTRTHKLCPSTTAPANLLGGLWGAAYGWTNLAIDQLAAIPPEPAWQTLSQNLLQAWAGQLSPSTNADRPTPIVFAPR